MPLHALSLSLSLVLVVAPQKSEQSAAEAAAATAAEPSPVETLRAEAERVSALVECKGTKAFLDATRALPVMGERTVLYDPKTRDALTAEAHAALAPEEQARFQPRTYPASFYYTTGYGSPLAYARALDVLGKHAAAGGDALSQKRILDFGYGGIGHLRLLASLGSDVVGVDVDPLLHAYYGESDQGPVAPVNAGGKAGTLELVHGRWPADEATRAAVGGGFDLFLSKNTLKKGYVRPAQKVDPRMLVDFGVPPEEFLPAVARVLKPGGHLLIYNICPAPRTDRYVPWAYGESPFTREEFAAAGFELLAFDVDDRKEAQELGWALGWDQQGQDVENDLYAWYTLARRNG